MPTCAWLVLTALVLVAPRDPSARRVAALRSAGRLSAAAPRAPRRRSAVSRPPWLLVPLVAAGVATLAGGPLLGLAGLAAGALAARLGRRTAVDRADRRSAAELTRAVDVLVGELEAGASQAAALTAAAGAGGACAGTLRSAASAVRHGEEAADVLLLAGGGFDAVGHAWRLGERSGAALVAVLDRVRVDLAAAAEQRRAATVVLAGPRSSAALLAGLPLVGIVLGLAMGADPAAFLLGTSAGRGVCAAGVVLDVAGIAWMSRILHRAQRP